jgi:hypothetical protein
MSKVVDRSANELGHQLDRLATDAMGLEQKPRAERAMLATALSVLEVDA